MTIDYSWIHSILRNELDHIKENRGYQAIKFHAELTGNEYSVSTSIDKCKAYEYRVNNTLDWIKKHEAYIVETVEKELNELFGGTETLDITIFPSVGYDIGIGLNKTVVVDVTNPLFESDVEELITLFIHEGAHTLFEAIHGSIKDNTKWSFETGKDVLDDINYCIYYEGIGVFAARNYRIEKHLTNETHPLTVDYITFNRPEYEKLHKALKSELHDATYDLDSVLEKAFGESRFVHRYGYEIFRDQFIHGGMDEIRQMINMGVEKFVEIYLN